MMRTVRHIAIGAVLVLLLGALLAHRQQLHGQWRTHERHAVLLVPDGTASDAHFVRIWQEAAVEEGVLLQPVEMGRWMRQIAYRRTMALPVILPDTYHRNVSDNGIAALQAFVYGGGQLMLVHDGGLLNQDGGQPPGRARLSALAGVAYGDRARHGEQLWSNHPIQGRRGTVEALHLPPGRHQPLLPGGEVATRPTAAQWRDADVVQVANYAQTPPLYPVMQTDGVQDPTQAMLWSAGGDVVAQVHGYGDGQTVFVNMPLTHLSEQTDGIFLNGFLRYFASEVAQLPMLASTPGATGVFVINWHVDDAMNIGYLTDLESLGAFEGAGAQSFHFTAGPDVDWPGDGKGMDVPNNPQARSVIARLLAQGHSIGSHGGWIHNFFGHGARDENQQDFEPYLDLNQAALREVVGAASLREYSSPLGNNPAWLYPWLERHGITGFYTVANVGMAPTRLWLEGERLSSAWAFPVNTNGPVDSAEEAASTGLSEPDFGAWLQEFAHFIESQQVMRMNYFHPIGAMGYRHSVLAFLARIETCVQQRACAMLSMEQAADFLTRRAQTQWSIVAAPGEHTLHAYNAESLQGQVWRMPRARYAQVIVQEGTAEVRTTDGHHTVHPTDTRTLRLRMTTTNSDEKH